MTEGTTNMYMPVAPAGNSESPSPRNCTESLL